MSKAKANHFLSETELELVATRFRLGEPMRLRILQAVCRQPHTVNEIVEVVGSGQANVSKHLALLAAAGILNRQKQGQRVVYRLKDSLAMKLCKTVRAHLTA